MPFDFCNAPTNFQSYMVATFSDFVKYLMKVFLDDFSVYGNLFDNCLANLSKVLQGCKEVNLVHQRYIHKHIQLHLIISFYFCSIFCLSSSNFDS